MTSPVRGVETNEFSRFIDHTLASPWETFISDVEKVVRTLNKSSKGTTNIKHIVEYVGNEFDIQIINIEKDPLVDRDGILSLFSCPNQSEVITATFAGGNATENVTKMTIISAINIAVKSIPDLRYPVFISTDAFGNETMDWIGYRASYSSSDRPQEWYKYESSTLTRMSTKHPFFFFDGIRRLYQRRVKSLTMPLLDETRLLEQFTSQITHTYQFDITQWMIHSTGRSMSHSHQQQLPIQLILSPSFDELLRLLLLRKVTFQKLLLTGIRVSIAFRERVPRGLIDNESYSTLLPSRQPPHRWTLSPVWKPLDLIHPFPEEATARLPWKSLCLRRLLAFLLLATFARRDNQQQQQQQPRRTTSSNTNADEVLSSPTVSVSSMSTSTSQSQSQQQTQQVEFSFEGSIQAKDLLAGLQLEELTVLAEKLSPLSQRVLSAALHHPGSSAQQQQPGGQHQQQQQTGGAQSQPTPHHTPHQTPQQANRKRSRSTSTRRSTSQQSLSSSVSLSRAQDEAEDRQEKYLQPILRQLFYTPTAVINGIEKESESESSKSFSHHNNNNASSAAAAAAFVSLGDDDGAAGSGATAWIERLSVISGLLPLRAVTIVRLWQACLRELHDHFDNGSPVHLFAEYEEAAQKDEDGDDLTTGSKQPLNIQLLWDDQIYWKQRDGIHVILPDQTQGLLVQKLQLLHFCTVMKHEGHCYEADAAFKSQYQTLAEDFTWPLLQRRVPLTSDVIALQKRIQQKFLDDASRTLRQQPLLRYQGLLPVLASDLAAFRQANPSLDLATFCEWYGLQTSEADGGADHELMPQLEELWQQTESRITEAAAEDQHEQQQVASVKPLFSAEKEANKTIADLERMSLSSFAMELVYQASKLILRLLQSSGDELKNEVLTAKLTALQSQIELLKPPQLPLKGEALANHLPGLCLLVDSIAEQIFAIEGLIHMLLQLRPVQDSLLAMNISGDGGEAVINSWLKSGPEDGIYCLQREEEVTALLHRMKSLSRKTAGNNSNSNTSSTAATAAPVSNAREGGGGGRGGESSLHNHEWLSHDGRELGLPYEKTFCLTASRHSSSSSHSSSQHGVGHSHSHNHHPHLPRSGGRSGGTTGLSSPIGGGGGGGAMMGGMMTVGSSYVSRVTSSSPGPHGGLDGTSSPLAMKLDFTATGGGSEGSLTVRERSKDSEQREHADCSLRLAARTNGSHLQVLWEQLDT